jgi:hypothetical protein
MATPETELELPPGFEQQCIELGAMIANGERITIAEAAKRTGLSTALITIILAAIYAVADEALKMVKPSDQSLH